MKFLNQLSKSSHVGLKYMTARSKLRGFVLFFFFQLMFPKSTLILLSVLFAMNQEFIAEGKKFWSWLSTHIV